MKMPVIPRLKKAHSVFVLAALALAACSSSRRVTFHVTRPAEITLPADVNTLLLIDRTKFSNQFLNTLEGILTGELPADDKIAAQEALISLKGKLDASPRFGVKILPDRFNGNSLDGSFPQALAWDFVDQLCAANQAEAVIALEVFDSDFIITRGTRIKKRTEGSGDARREVEYTEYYAEGVGNIKMGIRTYYAKGRTLIDQQLISKSNRWEGTGTSAADALAALISKSNANKHLARIVGGDYAYKISPMQVTISRPFYAKSKHIPEVEEGARYADVNKWEEAIDSWKRGLAKAEGKEAGRLAYNVAIGYEVLGEYGTALSWAQDAYTRYGNKDGRSYSYQLQNRIREEELLKVQMNH
jgi:hypothetical protein